VIRTFAFPALLACCSAVMVCLALPAPAAADEAFPPHQVIGNVYYVGSKDLASYLITGPEGHILINTGFEETVPLIRGSIEKLGFKLPDVKFLLASHAHSDHVAGHAAMQALTGAFEQFSHPRRIELGRHPRLPEVEHHQRHGDRLAALRTKLSLLQAPQVVPTPRARDVVADRLLGPEAFDIRAAAHHGDSTGS
jgi:glyoxylase-like metal-dependent hydrolase (beta-lactamase superfamily II)